jgi:hypothetical protein
VRNRTATAAVGSFATTGQSAGFVYGHPVACAYGSFATTGQVSGLRAARRLACAYGSFATTGQDAGLYWSGAPVAESGDVTQTMLKRHAQ